MDPVEEFGKIEIDVTEWVKETVKEEPSFTTPEEAHFEGRDKGWSARKSGQMYHTKQRMDENVEQFFDLVDNAEFAEGVHHKFLRRKPMETLTKTVMGEDGEPRQVAIGQYQAVVFDGTYILDSATDDASENMRNRMYTNYIGGVRRGLTLLKKNGCDVEAELEEFIRRLWEACEALINGE